MTLQSITSLPTPEEVQQARDSSRVLSKYADAQRVHLTLRGDNSHTDEMILPGHVVHILLNVLSEMAQGNAVSLIPYHQEIGTQEAADLLNVSRPHLVKLLEDGAIDFHKVGTHRRVRLTDVLAYKETIAIKRRQALDELGALSQQKDMGY